MAIIKIVLEKLFLLIRIKSPEIPYQDLLKKFEDIALVGLENLPKATRLRLL